MIDTMSWYWVLAALILPLAIGVLVAWPFWGRSRDSLGSGVGAVLILAFAIAFIGREYTHLQQFTGDCSRPRRPAVFHPSHSRDFASTDSSRWHRSEPCSQSAAPSSTVSRTQAFHRSGGAKLQPDPLPSF
jgi:hypothetical protein